MFSNFLNEDLAVLDVEYFLKKCVSKTKEVPAGVVLQVQQVTNLSVPKQDGHQQYDAERHVLKITLTDGETNIFALVTEPLQRLNLNTVPGTKIKFTQNVPINGQIIILSRNNIQVLGGDVPKLIEKWSFQRRMDIKQEWGSVGRVEGSEGPPLWRTFGQKTVPLDVAALRKMKAMDIVNEKKEGAGKEEGNQTQFDLQRNEAISELMEKTVKQKWQKPNKHLLDKEVMDIMDEGFSFDEASEALNKFKNPQKALRFLKARNGEVSFQDKSSSIDDRRERKKRNPKNQEEEEDVPIPKEYQRPTRSISLFGFIAEHIKGDENSTENDVNSSSSGNKKADEEFDSYHNSGFRENRGRGGRGYNRGGSNPRFRGHNPRGGDFQRSDHRTEFQSDKNSGGPNRYNDVQSQDEKPRGYNYNRVHNDFQSDRGSSRGGGSYNSYNNDSRLDRVNSGRVYNDFNRDSSRGGYNDYDKRMNVQDSFPPQRNYSSGPADSQKYSQPPRFQKQQYSSSGNASSVPFNNMDTFSSYQPKSYLSSSESFPPPGNYDSRGNDNYSRGNDSFYNSRQTNSQRTSGPPPQYENKQQYGGSSSDQGWGQNQTMVFTRSKPNSGSDRGRGGGGGGQNSGRYYQ